MNAEFISKQYHFEYQKASDETNLNSILNTFFETSNQPKLLEIDTINQDNATILKEYMKSMKLGN